MLRALPVLGMMLLLTLMGAARAESHAVSIKGGKCSPAKITITVGETIEFTNDDNKDHRLVSDDGAFDTGKLKPGETYKVKFSKAGTYTYACSLHPREKGTITVKKK